MHGRKGGREERKGEAATELNGRTDVGDRYGLLNIAAQGSKSEWFQKIGRQRQSLTRHPKKKIRSFMKIDRVLERQ